jgi:hypothetical protein
MQNKLLLSRHLCLSSSSISPCNDLAGAVDALQHRFHQIALYNASISREQQSLHPCWGCGKLASERDAGITVSVAAVVSLQGIYIHTCKNVLIQVRR